MSKCQDKRARSPFQSRHRSAHTGGAHDLLRRLLLRRSYYSAHARGDLVGEHLAEPLLACQQSNKSSKNFLRLAIVRGGALTAPVGCLEGPKTFQGHPLPPLASSPARNCPVPPFRPPPAPAVA